MRVIGGQWAATFVWLFSAPLLLADGDDSAGQFTYVFACLAALAVVLVPILRRAQAYQSLLFWLLLFLVLRGFHSLTFDDPARWVLECAYVGGAVVLAGWAGRTMEAADRALEKLAAGPESEQVAPFQDAQGEIYREIRRARRYERPASLMALSVAPGGDVAMEHLMREVQQTLAERYANGRVAKLLFEETDAAALVTKREDHFVILLPEVDAARARRVAARLGSAAANRWGLRVCSGIASFPDQEVTFEGMLERAESQLRAEERVVQGVEPRSNRAAGGDSKVTPLAGERLGGGAAPNWRES